MHPDLIRIMEAPLQHYRGKNGVDSFVEDPSSAWHLAIVFEPGLSIPGGCNLYK